MVWYNPKSWFGKKQSSEKYSLDEHFSGDDLICGNPQCKRVILNSEIAYDREHNEFYHDCDCAKFVVVHRTFKTGQPQFMQLEYFSREEAIKIKSGLEAKLESPEKKI